MKKLFITTVLLLFFACEQSMEINAKNKDPGTIIDHSQDIARGLKVIDSDGLTIGGTMPDDYDPMSRIHLNLSSTQVQVNLMDFYGTDEQNDTHYGDFGTPIFSNNGLHHVAGIFYEYGVGYESGLDIPNFDDNDKMFFKIENARDYEDAYEELPHSVSEFLADVIEIENIDPDDTYNFDEDFVIDLNENLTIDASNIQFSFILELDQYIVVGDETTNMDYSNYIHLKPTLEQESYTLSKENMVDIVRESTVQMMKWIKRFTGVDYDIKQVTVKSFFMHVSKFNLDYDKITVSRTVNPETYDIPIYVDESDYRRLLTDDVVINIED